MKSIIRLTWRSVRARVGRFLTLLLIVAVGVGFFAGLKITKDAMVNTGNRYFREQGLYDFRLLSTLGFDDADVAALAAAPGVAAVEGLRSVDALVRFEGDSMACQLLSLPGQVNRPSLTAGDWPDAPDECLADDEAFGPEDIGRVITLSDENAAGTLDSLQGREYTIVGLVDSPLFIGLDRGQTGIGNGSLSAFLYLPAGAFADGPYTEICLTLTEHADAYTQEYDDLIAAQEPAISDLLRQRADTRYRTLVGEVLAALGLPQDMELTDEMKALLAENGLAEPSVYLLTREENAGYVSFESDTSIISGIANIFPVFFILIAMLVCMTTMSRMVDEERTQAGTLKAMGCRSGRVVAKYLLYAGSATVLGWALGYFLCTWGIPKIFWFAYNAIYDFAPLDYLFSPTLALLTLGVTLVCILGAAFFSCYRELSAVPAVLIRPKAAKTGHRTLLERVGPLWRRLSFLQKIIVRNMMRYKRRLVMMLIGIGCCAGLVVTAFGVRDSMMGVGALQYQDVQTYDMEAVFETSGAETVLQELAATDGVDGVLPAAVHRVEAEAGEELMHSLNLVCVREADRLPEYWSLHRGGTAVALPGAGEALVNVKVAETLGLRVGDSLTLRDADLRECRVTVSGIFDNYISNYVLISEQTYAPAFGDWAPNTAMLRLTDGADDNTVAAALTALESVTGVSRFSATAGAVDDALSCLNDIIWVVILFSAALAFIVILNLTNINLAERSREIATVEVMGFFPHETYSYVLRENMILSVVASLLGLPLGALFHRVVMSMVKIELISFRRIVTPQSYLLAFACTVLFAALINLLMRRQIRKINMAESLKAVE